jgi:hypothetical protein
VHLSRTLAATAAVALGLAGSLALSAPASAAVINEISTSSVRWTGVNDLTGYISDSQPYDYATSTEGWTGDLFDGLPFVVTLSDDVASWDFLADETASTINQGGTSTIVMSGSTGDTFELAEYDVTLTLTFSGNYVRWSYAIADVSDIVDPANLAALDIAFAGNLGSDGNSQYVVSGNSMVSNDGESESDPAIAYYTATNGTFTGYTVANDDDDVEVGATGASLFELTIALVDYAPGNAADARALAASIAPNLPATFGASYAPFTGNAVVFAPVSLTAGTAVNQMLSYTVDERYTVDGGEFDYFAPDNAVVATISNVPAGLSISQARQPDGSFVFILSGTPTQAGAFAPSINFAIAENADGSGERFVPLVSSIGVTVAAAAVVAAPAQLAATGVDVAPALGFAGGIALLGAFLVAASRRRSVA